MPTFNQLNAVELQQTALELRFIVNSNSLSLSEFDYQLMDEMDEILDYLDYPSWTTEDDNRYFGRRD